MFGIFPSGYEHLYWGNIVMWGIAFLFMWFGISKKWEPLLLVPIGFGILVANLPLGELTASVLEAYQPAAAHAGVLQRLFSYTMMWEIVPCLIFFCIGAMTDFRPLIANPLSLILGAGAQFGVYTAFFVSLILGKGWLNLVPFGISEACSIGIIGGADGPTTIYLTVMLAPHILGATAVSAYTYMAMVPLIQPPVIKALTTKEERQRYMPPTLRPVSDTEALLFPLIVAIIVCLLVPKATPLIGLFMAGNLFRVCGVTDRLAETASTSFVDMLTIILGLCVGATMTAHNFLKLDSLLIFALGLFAFACSTFFGLILAKFMNLFLKTKINPMIGAAGVSAVPMAARVVQTMGLKENPRNYLLMHAMGPNVAGVIGTATAAGIFLGIVG